MENINAYIGFNQEIIGCIALHHPIRRGMKRALNALQKDFKQTILSGDPLKFSDEMLSIFPKGCHPFHGLSPVQKRSHIEQLKEQGNKVVMIGDGLNDAGALSAADVGIAVTEDAFGFSPSCDIIIESKQLHKVPQLIQYAQDQLKIVKWSFGISLLYNLIGLSIAVQGQMHPLIAAILMPSSSITIMGFTTLLAYWRRPR
jgi:Cu+-exporting ATPase